MIPKRRPTSVALRLPRITYIVARSYPDHVIGCENRLPWKLRDDLANFRKVTSGHAIIMGRKTLDSIGRPLPKRKNIVLSREPIFGYEGIETANTVEQAVWLADIFSILSHQSEYFIIGGDQIYRLFEKLCQRVILTEVFSDEIVGDAFYRTEFDRRSWRTVSEVDYPDDSSKRNSFFEDNDYPFRITIFDRKDIRTRIVPYQEFLTGYEEHSEGHQFDLLDRVNPNIVIDEYQQVELFD